MLATGHIGAGLAGFSFATFAVSWAWINFSWFAGYLHIVLFGSIVATGAGLHAAADYIEHRSELGSVATVTAVAVPVGVYVCTVFGTYLLLARTFDEFYAVEVLICLLVLAAAVGLAAAGISMAVCLLVVTAASAVVVASFELFGHRHLAKVIEQVRRS